MEMARYYSRAFELEGSNLPRNLASSMPLRKNKSRWRHFCFDDRFLIVQFQRWTMRKWQKHFRAWTPPSNWDSNKFEYSNIHLILNWNISIRIYIYSNSTRSLINLSSMNPCYQISIFLIQIFNSKLKFISKFVVFECLCFFFVYLFFMRFIYTKYEK